MAKPLEEVWRTNLEQARGLGDDARVKKLEKLLKPPAKRKKKKTESEPASEVVEDQAPDS